MQKRFLVFSLFAVLASFVMPARAEDSVRDLKRIEVAGTNALTISIGGSPELATLARKAFGVHGRYRVVQSGGFEVTLQPAGATAVTVSVKRGGADIVTQTVSGTSQRNATLRACDVAVKATSGLTGFFASRLAFVSNRSGADEIYVSDLFLGDATAVTNQRSNVMTPRWSPDGTRLLYTSYFRSGFPDIFVIDLAGRRWNTFVSFKGTNSGARFSPDGSKVVMVLSGEGNPDIYVSNAQGRGVSRKTRPPGVKSSPCFSPDGSRIVYTAEPGPQLYLMSASGGGGTRLNTGLSSYCAEPDWSRADPNKIAFTIRVGGRFQVAVYDLRTGKAEQVTKEGNDAIEPCWLADGRHLIYTARAANQRSLRILDTETGKSTLISSVYAEKASVAN
ncbi:biopolymer transporter Tol [Nibricoccus sp. IMCC34717]|uniref:biopolymer transporter Tol n=1 Tax=Nibricoccus sp. IMCC34717 TaxID=3034021 RepID=UPI00384BB1A2